MRGKCIAPHPNPPSHKTIHWIVLFGRVQRGEGKKKKLTCHV